MPNLRIFSIIESPSHPHFSPLYKHMGFQEDSSRTIRRANLQLKKSQPDVVVAQFFYGYSNNYSGVHISNLDVMLVSLKKYAPNAKVIVLVDKNELKYVDQLNKIFPLAAILPHPVSNQIMEQTLLALFPNEFKT